MATRAKGLLLATLLLISYLLYFSIPVSAPEAAAEQEVYNGLTRLALTRITEVRDFSPTSYTFYGVISVSSGERFDVVAGGGGVGGARVTYVIELGYFGGDLDRALISLRMSWSIKNSKCILAITVYYLSKERPQGVPITDRFGKVTEDGSMEVEADVTSFAKIPPPPEPGFEVEKRVVIEVSIRYEGGEGGHLVLSLNPPSFKVVRAPSVAISHEMFIDPHNESRVIHRFKLQPIRYDASQWSRVTVSIYFISYYKFLKLLKTDTGKEINVEGWSFGVEEIEYEGKFYKFNVLRRSNPFGLTANVRLTLLVTSENYILEAGVRNILNQTAEVLQKGQLFFIYAVNPLNYTDYEILSGNGRWKWGRMEPKEAREVERNGERIRVNVFYENFTLNEVPSVGEWKVVFRSKDEYNLGYKVVGFRVYDPSVVGSILQTSNTLLSGKATLLKGPQWHKGYVFMVDPSRLIVREDFVFEEEPGLSVTSATMINRLHNLNRTPQIRLVVYNNGEEAVRVAEMRIYLECAGEVSEGVVKFDELGESDVFKGRDTRAYLIVIAPFNRTPFVMVASGQTGVKYNVTMSPIDPFGYIDRPKLIVVKIGLGDKIRELPFLLYDPGDVVRGKLIEYREANVSPTGSLDFMIEEPDFHNSRRVNVYLIAHGEGFVTVMSRIFSDDIDFDYSVAPLIITGKPGEIKSLEIKIRSKAKSLTLKFTIQLLYGSINLEKARSIASTSITLKPGEAKTLTLTFTMPTRTGDEPEILIIYSPELDYMFKWVELSWEEPMEMNIGGNTVTIPRLVEIPGLPAKYVNASLIAILVLIAVIIFIKIALSLIRPS